MTIRLSDSRDLPEDQVVALYAANQWSSAKKPRQLLAALHGSATVITAWEGDTLVGLGNALSDGHLVVYYPHLLVLPTHHGRGVGAAIMDEMKNRYAGFHQHILVADGRAVDFYRKCGFTFAGATRSMWIYEGGDH